jgi:hypothetical protein
MSTIRERAADARHQIDDLVLYSDMSDDLRARLRKIRDMLPKDVKPHPRRRSNDERTKP